MTAGDPTVPAPRRAYIDWLRGLAVLCMILWHVVDAWHVPDRRTTAAFGAVVFMAGWAAPMFLFLAGVSLPLAGFARMARGVDRQSVARSLMRRGWQVFLIAHLFRLQSFLLSPHASWSSLLKPDILNVLGLGMVLATFGWARAVSPRTRLAWLLLPAVVVAGVLTPWVPDWWWPSLLPSRLEGYIRVVDGNAVFSLFPAVAYVLAGTFVGCLLAQSPPGAERRFHTRSAALGLALLGVTIGSMFVPLAPAAQRWTGPLLIVALRVGAMLLLMALLWRVLPRRPAAWGNPMLVLGRTSLFVYWVHVELAYGVVSYPLHRTLTLPSALAAWGLVTAAMYGAALLWLRWRCSQPLVPLPPVGAAGVELARFRRERT